MFRSTVLVAVIVFALAGCKTTGQQATAHQIESIQQLRTSLDQGSKQIGATVSSLEQLAATTTAGDLRPAYQKFTAELAKLDADAAAAKSRADAMKARAKEHLAMWEQETRAGITNPELRKISEEQRARARERFEDLQTTAATGRDAYQKLSTNLHETQKVLDLNLNAAGITAIKPIVDQARVDAKTAQQAIGEIVVKLDNVKNALSPTSGTPVPASGTAPPTTSP